MSAEVAVPREMKLRNALSGDSGEVGRGVEAMVECIHVDVVDIEQDTAVGGLGHAREKFPFAHRRFAIREVARDILDKNRTLENILNGADSARDVLERRLGERQRQQVVEVAAADSR